MKQNVMEEELLARISLDQLMKQQKYNQIDQQNDELAY